MTDSPTPKTNGMHITDLYRNKRGLYMEFRRRGDHCRTSILETFHRSTAWTLPAKNINILWTFCRVHLQYSCSQSTSVRSVINWELKTINGVWGNGLVEFLVNQRSTNTRVPDASQTDWRPAILFYLNGPAKNRSKVDWLSMRVQYCHWGTLDWNK